MSHKTIALIKQFNQHPHQWSAGWCDIPCKEPCCLLGSCFCFPCANYKIRKEVLNGQDYRCFQGYYCGVLACCCPCQSECGSCCLFGESIFCPHVSVMATRHFVQEKYHWEIPLARTVWSTLSYAASVSCAAVPRTAVLMICCIALPTLRCASWCLVCKLRLTTK